MIRGAEYKVETFDFEGVTRITHKKTGIKREVLDASDNVIHQAMRDIDLEVKKQVTLYDACPFHVAIKAVVEEGKGMRVDGWPGEEVVRAQQPDEYSMNTLPYLYVITKQGRYPWAIDTLAPFCTWRVID